MLYPFVFTPIFKDRIWGGRELERLYGKKLPSKGPIGESWEVSDRPGDASVISNGPLAGKTLRWLMENHGEGMLGSAKPAADNHFPILCKILDARDRLSLQVHPPAQKAAELKGEPKTEMWYIVDALPGAELYVGLKRGVTRQEFEKKIHSSAVADCFQKVPVKAGDTMFLPSGRVHAIGAGLVIFEIQQNSDTTYRVYDWDRKGLDGKPRELHIPQSLASINFNDFEPALVKTAFASDGVIQKRPLVQDTLFNVEAWKIEAQKEAPLKPLSLQIIAVTKGELEVRSGKEGAKVSAGQFCVVPAESANARIIAHSEAELLRVLVV
jgi:mannose-6-phosphate isomerase